MKRIIRAILKQHETPPWLGGLKDLWSRITVYLSIVTALMMAITMWTTEKPNISKYASWFSFPMFLGIIAFGALVLALIEWKVMYSSGYKFTQRQGYMGERNPMRADIEQIKATQISDKKETDEKLEAMTKAIEGLAEALKIRDGEKKPDEVGQKDGD